MFISPQEIVSSLNLRKGDTVADFGCGSGAYVFAASKIVGDRGKVYAVDMHTEMLEKLNRDAEKMSIINIHTILANVEEKIPIERFSCDVIILSNLFSVVKDINKVLEEVKRILKPEGVILVVDWKGGEGNIFQKRQIIEEEKIIAILANNNFNVKKHFPAGDYHYAFSAMQ